MEANRDADSGPPRRTGEGGVGMNASVTGDGRDWKSVPLRRTR